MTTAPPRLSESRRLLLDNLDAHENSTAYATDLDPAEVGIVGDAAHIGEGDSYHLGIPEQGPSGYSVSESPRDKAGLCGYASAIDVGSFSVTVAGKVHNLRTFSVWLAAECEANAPDTRDIREVIYSPDGNTVKRWDRLRRRSSGDSSHLWHTHISVFRDATKAGRGLVEVFTRYLTHIGLLEDPDMPLTDADIPVIRAALHGCGIGKSTDTFGLVMDRLRSYDADTEALKARVDEIAAKPATVVTIDLATATDPAFLAAFAKAVNDDAARRMTQ